MKVEAEKKGLRIGLVYNTVLRTGFLLQYLIFNITLNDTELFTIF